MPEEPAQFGPAASVFPADLQQPVGSAFGLEEGAHGRVVRPIERQMRRLVLVRVVDP
jgi:hypothetical protein